MGYYNERRIRPGEVFEIPDKEKPGRWMEVVEKKKRPVKKLKDEEPAKEGKEELSKDDLVI